MELFAGLRFPLEPAFASAPNMVWGNRARREPAWKVPLAVTTVKVW